MLNSKNRILTLILTLVYIVPISAANNQTKEMAEREYANGENRYFHAEISTLARYTLYGKLCYHAPGCCVSTPEEGQRLIESYMDSQRKTCQGVTINEENFEPQNALMMIETIETKQKEDLEKYYLKRTLHNPEKRYSDFLLNSFNGQICSLIAPLSIVAPLCIRFESLRKTLPPNTPIGSITEFVSNNNPYLLPGSCLLVSMTSVNCLCHRVANL